MAQTPEKLLERGLKSIQKQIGALEKIQRKIEPCPECKLGGGLLPLKHAQLLVQLVELTRKSAADQMDPMRVLKKLTEEQLERMASPPAPRAQLEPVPERDEQTGDPGVRPRP